MFDDDDYDERIWVPVLTVCIVTVVAIASLFWIPLISYSRHWWLP